MPNTVWSNLYAKRTDWTLRAYKDFVATVHPTLRGDLERQDQVTLVVYGPTQVGKTTLILSTLGIHADRLADVSQVLRGGREEGKSATVLATRYGKSADELWRLGGGEGLSGADMLEALGSIRYRMENGDDVGSDVVDIRIPRHFFAEADRGLNVSIIDLPGTHAAQESEMRHVARLAEMYVPTADIVLLVTRADALGALHPAALHLECLKDWRAQPAKFRVVLTYTFSSASIQEWYHEEAEKGHADVESLRNRLYGQLSTHDLPLPEAGSRSLFPVEFGDSWKDLASKQTNYFEGASAISQSLMSELVEGLATASNPYRRLAAAFDLNALVERKKERLDAEFDVANVMLTTEIERASFRFRTAKKALGLARKAEDRSSELLDYLCDKRFTSRHNKATQKAFAIKVCEVSSETVAAMRWSANKHIDGLIEAWRKLRFDDGENEADQDEVTCDSSWQRALMDNRPAAPPRVENAYIELFTALDKHVLADYYPRMPGSSFEGDCNLLRSSGARAQSIAINETTDWLKVALENTRKATRLAVKQAGKKVNTQTIECKKSDSLHRDLLARKSELEKTRDETCEAMETSIERSRMFRKRMTEGYRGRDDELAKNIRDERKPSRRFLLHALRDIHQREFSQALEGHQA